MTQQEILDEEDAVNEAKDKHDIISAIEQDIKKGNIQKFQLTNDDIYYWASKLKVKIDDNEADWVMSMLDEVNESKDSTI